MAVLFIDTSALIRRYDPREPGAGTVRQLCRPGSGNVLLISRLTLVEVASALNRKRREGVLDAHQLQQHIELFRRHSRRQYRVVALDESTFVTAERLLSSYPLRAADALHVAGALHARQLLVGVTTDFRFCTADRAQADAATGEGMTTQLIA